MIRVFLSYNFADEPFVRRVNACLRKQPNIDSYCYADERKSGAWATQVETALETSQAFVTFVGGDVGATQALEAEKAMKSALRDCAVVFDLVDGRRTLPMALSMLQGLPKLPVQAARGASERCAREIIELLNRSWIPDDDLPRGYPFDYEKRIIEEYASGSLSNSRIEEGCPRYWPSVERGEAENPNPVPEHVIGAYRGEAARLYVDARQHYETPPHNLDPDNFLRFPEAGPRKNLRYPIGTRLRVGLLVSGGIAPGINAVIDGIVQRHTLYAEKGEYLSDLDIYGYREGFNALVTPGDNFSHLGKKATRDEVRDRANEGGSILTTSRAGKLQGISSSPYWRQLVTDEDPELTPESRKEALNAAITTLRHSGIQILYVIGGDGSMKAAHAIWKYARDQGLDLSVVGIPKTMDNDIFWCWQSFGFLSAVERAKEIVQQLYTEARSNPRLCIIQLFGSDSGFVVNHAALASGVCDLALIPEVKFTVEQVSEYIRARLRKRYRDGVDGYSPYGVILMAETAIPQDVYRYLDDEDVRLTEDEKKAIVNFVANGRRVYGQPPDDLRAGGLKILSRVLQRDIQRMTGYWEGFRVFTNEPRHVIRAIPPSVSDITFGQRLGALAVDNALAGYTDFMVSQWLTEYVLVPLKLVALGRKRVPQDGIFWRSLLAKTVQPEHLGRVFVGVTGHRFLAEKGQILNGVDQAIRQIEVSFPEQQITIFSALAAGTDCIVAKRILERPGTRLVAVLPVPASEYRERFDTGESKEEFDALHETAEYVIQISNPERPTPEGEIAEYDVAAHYVLNYSDALIAVWDGQVAPQLKGTGTNVGWARERKLPIAWVHAGNRRPGTQEATTLGKEQGTVSYENFPGR